MNILIDIGHPAHVHLFKNFAWFMQKKGHEILFTCREKEFEIYLLKKYNFTYKSFGKKYISTIGKIFGLIEFDIKEFLTGLKFKPDIFLSHGSIYAAHAAFLLRKPHIAFEDTGNMEQIKLYKPFTTTILTPFSLNKNLGNKQINYSGYHELAYLHPNYFSSSPSALQYLELTENDIYFIVRFVSWNASHDVGQKGIDFKTKIILIEELLQYGKVFISAEDTLPQSLKQYQINIPPEIMHDTLAYATLFIGEGATMANESAILGTPAIYINSRKACIGDLEHYGLLFHYVNKNGIIKKTKEILKDSTFKHKLQNRQTKLLSENIDVTAFLVWFVENYPNSAAIMKENPIETQKQFM